MKEPKLAASTDAEWRAYYEAKCREQRKEIERLESVCNRWCEAERIMMEEGWTPHMMFKDAWCVMQLRLPSQKTPSEAILAAKRWKEQQH